MTSEESKYYVYWFNPATKRWEAILETDSKGKAEKYIEAIEFQIVRETRTTTKDVIFQSEGVI